MVRVKSGEMCTDEGGKTWIGLDVIRHWPGWLSLSTLVQTTVEGTVVITVLQALPSTIALTYYSQCDTEAEAAQLAAELTLEWALR